MIQSLLVLAVCAVVVQFCTDRSKALIPEAIRTKSTPYIALAFGLAVAFCTGTGIFGVFGIALSPAFVDYIITGIAYSGGAVAFNELVKLIRDMRMDYQSK